MIELHDLKTAMKTIRNLIFFRNNYLQPISYTIKVMFRLQAQMFTFKLVNTVLYRLIPNIGSTTKQKAAQWAAFFT
jgi:hypothetical protein